jgi:hypothetical protein
VPAVSAALGADVATLQPCGTTDRQILRREGRAGSALSTTALIVSLAILVATLAFFADRSHNGDFFLQLLGGRFVAIHGFVNQDPFPTISHGQPWLNQQWLSELAFYGVARAVGYAGLAVVYSTLLALPILVLLRSCRSKGIGMLLIAAALYVPVLTSIAHPRAAGFTVLLFSVLVAMMAAALRGRFPPISGRGGWLWWALIPLLFALWANLHGGFVAGLLLIAAVAAGSALDRRAERPSELRPRQLAALAVSGLLAVAAITVATPLGGQIWSYIVSLRNPGISLASGEWRSSLHSTPAVVYLVSASALAAWLWARTPRPRPLMPLLVAATFIGFGALAVRNLVFVGPAMVLVIACAAPDRDHAIGLRRAAAACAAALAAGLLLGADPDLPRNQPPFGSALVRYAIAHPPRVGRIAAYAGTGSYILWRSPQTPVVLDGWLEHFSAQQLRETYTLLDARSADPTPYVRKLGVGAVIATRPRAVRSLERHGFVVRFAGLAGTYLVGAWADSQGSSRGIGPTGRRQRSPLQAASALSRAASQTTTLR